MTDESEEQQESDEKKGLSQAPPVLGQPELEPTITEAQTTQPETPTTVPTTAPTTVPETTAPAPALAPTTAPAPETPAPPPTTVPTTVPTTAPTTVPETPAPAPAPAPTTAPAPIPAPVPETSTTTDPNKPPLTPDPEFSALLVEKGAHTLNLCFQCGTCTGSCASGRFTAFRTRKVIRRAQLGLKDQILPSDDLWMCTTCYTCYERCPRGVEIPDIIFLLRNLAVQAGYMAEPHKKVAGLLVKTGHMVPLSDEYQAVREKMGLKSKPDTILTNEKAKGDFNKLIQLCKFDKLIGLGGE